MPEKKIGSEESFQTVICWNSDPDWDFDHYGKFCELPGDVNVTARWKNDPNGGDFYIRYPPSWRKVNNIWQRVRLDLWGWFKLAQHPREAVRWSVENEGADEREAWQAELDRLRRLVCDLGDAKIHAIWIRVEVRWRGRAVGLESLHSVEMENGWPDEDEVERTAREHGLLEAAWRQAKEKIGKICAAAMVAAADTAPDGATNAA